MMNAVLIQVRHMNNLLLPVGAPYTFITEDYGNTRYREAHLTTVPMTYIKVIILRSEYIYLLPVE